MKASVAAPLAFLWTSIAFAQQVASVDLTRPPGLAWPAEKPNGCEQLVIGMWEGGYVEPEDHKPHEIVLELSNIEDVRPIAGSELKAEVKLRNSGKQPIQIPWSTDPSTIENGQNPDNLVWDVGTFEFALRSQPDDQVRLKSLTQPLLGSKFSPGSLITIQPGDWITAVVKFKLKDEYGGYDGPLKAGKWQLSAEWQQSQKQRRLDGCRATTFDLRYKHYYQQQNPSVAIQIIGDGLDLARLQAPRGCITFPRFVTYPVNLASPFLRRPRKGRFLIAFPPFLTPKASVAYLLTPVLSSRCAAPYLSFSI